jgi:signal transduction histidine kinase
MLWKITLAAAVLFFWIAFTAATLQTANIAPWLIAIGVLAAGCSITRWRLKHNQYTQAAWAYALGGIISVFCIMLYGDARTLEIMPFMFPLIVFVVGLLLPPSSTLLMTVGIAALIAFMPSFNAMPGTDFGIHQGAAIMLTLVSALLAAQVTGELYQVTEWALLNYQKERSTNNALFESRQQLERALTRSQALSEQLQKTNVELDQARATAEEAKHFRGQFLANMSHELRTPLNAIIGFSQTMLQFPQMYDDVGLPKAYNEDLNQIYNSGKQLLTLINDILDLSKVDAGKLEVQMRRVELDPIIEGVLAQAAGLVGSKPVKLEKDLIDPLPLVWADETRVRQVLTNLYSNAVKFTDSGSITLIVREVDEGVRISVKDTGPGIDPKNHLLIFEEFKQAETEGRDPRSGAGLGLAISRQLLELMDGRIWVESEVGKGSTFHFTLFPYRRREKDTAKLTTQDVEREKVM